MGIIKRIKAKVTRSNSQPRTAIRPSYVQRASYNTLMPPYPNVPTKETYWEIYKNEAPVRGAVKVIINAVCSTGWDIRTYKQGDVDMEDPRVKQITDWLAYPDQPIPFDNIIMSIAEALVVHDDVFLEVVKNTADSYGWLYCLDTRDCEFYYNTTGSAVIGLKHQVISNSSGAGYKQTILDLDQFIHGALYMGGSTHGLSSIESLVTQAKLNQTVINYNYDLFLQNGVPTLHINTEEANQDDYDLLLETVKETKQGETLVTRGKVNTTVIGGKANELNSSDLSDSVYQDVMTVFQIPPVLMCVPGESTSESSREETNSFAMNIRTIQKIINNMINRAIIRIWGDSYADLRFELKPWINEKSQAAIDEIGIKCGWLVPNDILKRDGKATKEYGDKPFAQNFIPQLIGEVPWQPAGTNTSAGKPSEPEGGRAAVDRPRRQGAANSNKDILVPSESSPPMMTNTSAMSLSPLNDDLEKGQLHTIINELLKSNDLLQKLLERDVATREQVLANINHYYLEHPDEAH